MTPGKQTVGLLYRRDLEERLSLLIRGTSHANCTLVAYANPQDVEGFI
jgi:hypothetical protein